MLIRVSQEGLLQQALLGRQQALGNIFATGKLVATVPMLDAERVRERMALLGLSQAELARRVGVSQQSIARLVSGEAVGSRYLHVVARELRTTPAYLTRETDDAESDFEAEPLSGEEREWIDLLRALEPGDRKSLLQLARSLAQNAAPATVHSPKHEYRAER